jgi:hypothetical protein
MMLNYHPDEYVFDHQRELVAEANQARLASQLPQHESAVRRGLATACYRLANWLDAPSGYVQLPDPGPEDWVRPWASV